MVEPSLEFIAERLERLQTEFRAFRHLSSDVAQLRADLLRVQENLSDLRLSHDTLRESHDALREYTLELRTRMDAGFAATDDHFRAIQVQFDQMARQMATNLEIVLAEIRRAIVTRLGFSPPIGPTAQPSS
jgi:predicted  nucleic acid-binding Zn-ribbon protein